MRLPFGKRGLIAATAIIGAVVYYRVRQSRQESDREWDEDIAAATDEGMATARAAKHSDDV